MKKHLFAAIILFLITLIFTFPLVLHLNSSIPGFFSTDEPYGTIWNFWLMKYSYNSGVSSQATDMVAYPAGIKLFSGLLAPYPWLGLNYLLAVFTNALLAYNIQVLANFFLSAVFTYLLVFFLTGNSLAGIISALIFSFCPQHFTRSWQHLSLTYFEWLPLILLAALMLYKDRRLRKVILFAVSLLLLFSFDFSIAYLGLAILFSLLLYLLFINWRRGTLREAQIAGYFKKVSWGFVIPAILTLRQILIICAQYGANPASAFNPSRRPFEDLFAQSAKPLSYLLPATVHPILGRFTEQFIGSSLYGVSFTEHTLYLGWVPMILAFVAFRQWRRNRNSQGQSPKNWDSPLARENFYIGFFIFLAITAWLFSQPPWWRIGPVKIYMPSFFMYKILPMFRAYCRFGIVLILAVAVLAGFGLRFVLEKFKSSRTKAAMAIIACGLVLFEFWNWPPYKVIDVFHVPAVYYWLKEQPRDIIIAEYPLDADSPDELRKFYQTVHEKRMINGTIPGTPAHAFAQGMVRLSELNTAQMLKGIGVKYVLVHRDGYLQTGLMQDKEEFKKIPQNKGLKLIGTFTAQECPDKDIMCLSKTGPIDVYEVSTQPQKKGLRHGK